MQDSVGTDVVTEPHGGYKIILGTGVYDMQVSFVGYNTLIIKKFKLNIGDIKELSILLGQGHGITEYLINGNNNYILQVKKKD